MWERSENRHGIGNLGTYSAETETATSPYYKMSTPDCGLDAPLDPNLGSAALVWPH